MANDTKTAFTITDLTIENIGGSCHGKTFLKDLIKRYNIEPVGKTPRDAPLYRRADIEAAIGFHQESKGMKVTPIDGEDEYSLRREKTKAEIENIKKDSIKKDLTIEQLKRELISYKEVESYLTERKQLANAILRKILLQQIPVHIPGLSIAEAKQKGQEYYNECMDAFLSPIEDWKNIHRLGLEGPED